MRKWLMKSNTLAKWWKLELALWFKAKQGKEEHELTIVGATEADPFNNHYFK